MTHPIDIPDVDPVTLAGEGCVLFIVSVIVPWLALIGAVTVLLIAVGLPTIGLWLPWLARMVRP